MDIGQPSKRIDVWLYSRQNLNGSKVLEDSLTEEENEEKLHKSEWEVKWGTLWITPYCDFSEECIFCQSNSPVLPE